MVYTEYFVKGTQPTTECPLHPSGSFMDRLAGVFGVGHPESPVPADEAGLPPVRTGTSGVSRPPSAPPDVRPAEPEIRPDAEERPKKRGFWARVFGKGGDKKKEEKKDEKRNEKKDDKRPGGGLP
jgi:hypothetical protein